MQGNSFRTTDAGDSPTVATPDEQNTAAPGTGENSFTETSPGSLRQIVDVTGLKLTGSGVRRGAALKDGKSIAVALKSAFAPFER